MFDSLAEQMKHDDALATSPRQSMTKWAMIAAVAVAVFAAVYFVIQAGA
jgi:cell division protein FtsX